MLAIDPVQFDAFARLAGTLLNAATHIVVAAQETLLGRSPSSRSA